MPRPKFYWAPIGSSESNEGSRVKIISGNSNPELAQKIASYLDMSLCKTTIKRFADNEIFVTIDENVRGEDVFVIQSTSHHYRKQDHIQIKHMVFGL